ncbi:hypothetical protein, partial [Microbulbifer sp.]|uniref:hypothetical protein n=1 Tax=Microbulbifer sp. TaxID=1908541 RepID=UPI003F36C942
PDTAIAAMGRFSTGCRVLVPQAWPEPARVSGLLALWEPALQAIEVPATPVSHPFPNTSFRPRTELRKLIVQIN